MLNTMLCMVCIGIDISKGWWYWRIDFLVGRLKSMHLYIKYDLVEKCHFIIQYFEPLEFSGRDKGFLKPATWIYMTYEMEDLWNGGHIESDIILYDS